MPSSSCLSYLAHSAPHTLLPSPPMSHI
ncbi:hypothetical protein E2C01_005132 [Portunus trituberculatus]|uniref:Uncharacterized protein n=1 Tax=Portunus trituberculatus TaxID=210409 RepID=A0A5B7CVT5_PORTR|nr:hypothetical protein [Portunus trituberculatus]